MFRFSADTTAARPASGYGRVATGASGTQRQSDVAARRFAQRRTAVVPRWQRPGVRLSDVAAGVGGVAQRRGDQTADQSRLQSRGEARKKMWKAVAMDLGYPTHEAERIANASLDDKREANSALLVSRAMVENEVQKRLRENPGYFSQFWTDAHDRNFRY
jgi:hypothetical protein